MNYIHITPVPERDLGRLYRFPADKYKIDVKMDTLTLFQGDAVVVVWKWSDVHFFMVERDGDDD